MLPVALFVVGVFPAEVSAATINSAAINVTEPIHGQNPNYKGTSAVPSLYDVMIPYWYKCATATSGCVTMLSTETFVDGGYYTVYLNAFATFGNEFGTSVPVTINGQVAESGNDKVVLEASRVFQAKHSYGFNITPAGDYTFPAKMVGYSAVDEYAVAVQSISTVTIKVGVNISGSAQAFDITTVLPGNPTQDITLGTGGGKVTYRISPKKGLAVGTYSAKFTIIGTNSPSKAFNVSFTVKAEATDSSGGGASGDSGNEGNLVGDGYDEASVDNGSGVAESDGEFEGTVGVMEAKCAGGDGTTKCGGEEKRFNWLWALFGGLLAVAVGCGVGFFLVQKKGKVELGKKIDS